MQTEQETLRELSKLLSDFVDTFQKRTAFLYYRPEVAELMQVVHSPHSKRQKELPPAGTCPPAAPGC